MTRRLTDQARTALTDATVIATLVDAALNALDLGLAGWAEHTPGASPSSAGGPRECRIPDCDHMTLDRCQLHDTGVQLTATERLGTTPDQARRDLELLQHSIRAMARTATVAARICHRWGLEGVTDTEVKTGLADKVAEIWCANCAKAGLSTVRIQGRTDCRFCAEVRQRGTCGVANPNHYPAPKSLLEIHVRRRLNSADFTRCMAAEYGLSWNKKMKKGKAA